ncbi:hypothetical protein BX666DRAFT_1901143 [Dichotomocladium elegans]|nr:hypothetical protein BX666DRAFT_1901143 [Dichotomocladium elegans]
MSDLNWCTYCDKSINSFSTSLYCSEECLRSDALNHHPLLGYDWHEYKDFPRSSSCCSSSASSIASSSSPRLLPTNFMPTAPRLSPPTLDLEPAFSKRHSPSSPSIKKTMFFI